MSDTLNVNDISETRVPNLICQPQIQEEEIIGADLYNQIVTGGYQ